MTSSAIKILHNFQTFKHAISAWLSTASSQISMIAHREMACIHRPQTGRHQPRPTVCLCSRVLQLLHRCTSIFTRRRHLRAPSHCLQSRIYSRTLIHMDLYWCVVLKVTSRQFGTVVWVSTAIMCTEADCGTWIKLTLIWFETSLVHSGSSRSKNLFRLLIWFDCPTCPTCPINMVW